MRADRIRLATYRDEGWRPTQISIVLTPMNVRCGKRVPIGNTLYAIRLNARAAVAAQIRQRADGLDLRSQSSSAAP